MKNPFFYAASILLIMSVLVSGCIGDSPQAGQKKTLEKQEILISGSGSGVEILKPLADAFGKNNPGITVRFLAPTSTGDGIVGAGEGNLDIGSLARKMKDSEKAKYPDLAEEIYVKDAMILAVNPVINVSSITSGQVRGIHAGNITDWSEVGGQSGTIVLLDREESESSKIILRKEVLGPNLPITPKAVMLYSADTTNKEMESNAFAIGQASLGSIQMSGLKIKPLAIDGVMPSPGTIKSGEYRMVREYGIAYKKEGASDAVKIFVGFIFSDEAAHLLAGYGFVPVPRN